VPKRRVALPLDPASFVAESAPDKLHYVQAFQTSHASMPMRIPLDLISPSQAQPRKVFDPQTLSELASSIAEVGVLEPIIVRQLEDSQGLPPSDGHQYQIVIGERRWRAAQEAGLYDIPCIIRELSDADAFLLALSENVQRDDLTPLEEAEAFQHLIISGAVPNQAELARRLGVSRARISQKIKLVHLDHHSKTEMLRHPRQITEHHAQQLLRIPSLDLRHQALDVVLETGISARSLNRRLRQLSSFPLIPSPSDNYQVSHPGFSLRIAFDLVDRERAIGDLVDAIGKIESIPSSSQSPAPEAPLPGIA